MKVIEFKPNKDHPLYNVIQSANIINSILYEIKQMADEVKNTNREARVK